MDIEDIRVYDPKSDGIDAEQYLKIKEAFDKINPKAFYFFHDGLYKKVLYSEIKEGTTLEDFLFREDGYLKDNRRGAVVIFLDGKFHSEYFGKEMYSEDLEELSKSTNSIPFAFSYSPAKYDYFLTH